MTALLNPKLWIALALAVVLALGGLFLYRAGRAAVQVDWNAKKAVDAESRLLADRAQRAEETRRQTAIDKEVTNAQPMFQAEARDAAELPDSRLREPAVRYLRRACPDPVAPSAGTPATDPLMVFADVFGRLEQRSEDLARLAGERGAAGTLCERYADQLQPAAGQPATGAVSGP